MLLLGKNLERISWVIPSSVQLSAVFLLSNVERTALPAGINTPRADVSLKWCQPGASLKNSFR